MLLVFTSSRGFAAEMSDGTILKADKDYTSEVDAALPEAEKTAQVYIATS